MTKELIIRVMPKSEEEKLLAISPCDGRYYSKNEDLEQYFSEFAIIRSRLMLEVRYVIWISNVLNYSMMDKQEDMLINLYKNLKPKEALLVKEKEKITNHDNKAVEYFLKEKMKEMGFDDFHINHVHFGLTSYDVEHGGSLQYRLDGAHSNCLMPNYCKVLDSLSNLVEKYRKIPMLAHTHGQPASPTNLGKEINVFKERSVKIIKNKFNSYIFEAKFGGATGNLNAHYFAYPEYNWRKLMTDFVENELSFKYQDCTTQIMNYDSLCAYFNSLTELNNVYVDLCRDMWTYISMKYFKLKVNKDEVGSSAMPHKVNPIDFENAEGNFGLANAILSHMSDKLAKSRLQRDLTDSTVLRYIGVAYGQILTALKSLQKGLSKIEANVYQITSELESDYSVLTEAVVAILIRGGVPSAYDKIRKEVRTGIAMTKSDYSDLILKLSGSVNEKVIKELLSLQPTDYIGDSIK